MTYVDYKDVNLLRTFIFERAKIRSRRLTGLICNSSARNRRNDPDRVVLRECEPVVRRHVEFREWR